MKNRWVTVTLLVMIVLGCHAGCQNSLDCQLVGDCVAGVCQCDAAWSGENCETLNQLPGWLIWPTSKPSDNASSAWGASIIKGPDNLYHVFEDVVCDNITDMHVENAVIAHATADNIQGPYTYKDISLPRTSFNPHLIQAPDGTYLIYHCIQPAVNHPPCVGLNLPQAKYSYANGIADDPGFSLGVAASKSLSGPWTIFKYSPPLPPFEHYENPSTIFLSNGTLLMALRGDQLDGERLLILKADHWQGPFVPIGQVPIFSSTGEDPFLWQSKRGFHIVYHAMSKPNDGFLDVGGYGYSQDALTWYHAPKAIYTTTVPLQTNNEVFFRRERPEFYIENGELAYLISGVQKIRKLGFPSYTALNPIKRSQLTGK